MTEDIMLQDPKGTVVILAWFADFIKKKYPGYWKIMFRPAVLDWLMQQPEPTDESIQGVYVISFQANLHSNFSNQKLCL